MNKLTAEKCREQFEEWLKSTGQNPPYATKRGYWEIWKASRQDLEIALPILEQQERGEGDWIDWAGGECPVDANAKVEFKTTSGAISRAKFLNWHHIIAGEDIIAYRIIPERATNQNGDEP